jgi:hypothetical protein
MIYMRYCFIPFMVLLLLINECVIGKNKIVEDSILEVIRNTYYESVEDETKLIKLQDLIRNNFSDSISQYPPIILAYFGGAEALKAKHAFWPFNKLSYFNSAMGILETAVNKEPENLEIRFIRFSILNNIPGILGHSKEREIDKNKIILLLCRKNYFQLKESIQDGIIQYMLDSGGLSPEQINLLHKNFPQYTED